ncbi:MAG: class I SAM-dependent methyltransferase [Desulfobacterales bacterium]|nr:class I SAM-dependent methyltransferase [Desulfobacterales bacterium]
MGLYEKYIFPKMAHLVCSMKPFPRQREKVVPIARGVVLEVGVGSGLNLPYYDGNKVTKVWCLDPSPEMLRMAEKAAKSLPLKVEFIGSPGEEIPLEDNSVDTVVVTYTLCTIADTEQALRQMARVLKPGGELIFCEHGAAPDEDIRCWQERINPVWKLLAGGCHLNRPIPKLIEQGGFRIKGMEAMYIPGWRPASFNYCGMATHA